MNSPTKNIIDETEFNSKERTILYNSFMNAPSGIAILKGHTHIYEFVNINYEKLVGRKITLGKTLQDHFPEIEQQGYLQMVNNVFLSGEPFIANELPVEININEGGVLEKFFLNLSIQPLKDEKGNTEKLLAHISDVTDSVNARKQIEESEKTMRQMASHLKLATDSANVGTWSLNVQTQELQWSALHKKMWGYDEHRKDLTYEDWYKIILPEDKELALQRVENARINHIFYEVEYRINKADDNTLHYIRSAGQYYYNDKGEAETLTGISIDITEQKKAEERLKASEQDLKRYKHMVDNATEPFILMREDGTFAYLNDLAIERWGYTKEEAQNIRVPDVDPIYNDEVFNEAFAASQKEKIPQFETLHKKKDGTIYPVEINMGGLTLDGKPHMFAIARDITERKKLEDSLRKSEEKIRSFILQAPVAMCLYRGSQYIIEIVNDALLTIWDKPLDSVINKSVFDALPEARGQGFEELLNKVYTTGEKFSAFGIPFKITRNGKLQTIYVNLVYEAYRDVDNVIAGIVEVVSDVTEQVVATQQIELSEKQFRTFADSIQNLAWIANGEGWIYWYNQRWYDYTGTTLEEMQGWGWEKVHHPDHIGKVVEFVKEAWTKDKAFELTFPLRRHDGKYHWFLTRAYPVKDAQGNIERWIGTNTDITEQKSFTEELETKVKERTNELELQNETFKLAEKIAKFGSYKWNITLGSLEYSDNLFRLFDYEPQGFVPSFEKYLSFIHPDDLQEVINSGEETMQTGMLVETPYRIISKTGKIKHLRSSGSFTGDHTNRILIGTVQDISQDIEAAEELRDKNQRLEFTNAQLASFTYAASHDLQEPLRKIRTFSKHIIEIEKFSGKTQEYFNIILSAGERMQNLIVSLLDYSRTDIAGLNFVSCDLNAIIEESKIDLNLSIHEKQATIVYENLPTINGMSVQLSQLFTNLIDNAVKYSRPEIKPYIRITSELIHGNKIEHPLANKQKEYYAIKIADNGIGFESEYAYKIFELFQRLHAKNEYSGTGVGLAIVKKIVTNHKGFIVAEGKPNVGSTFILYIPTA